MADAIRTLLASGDLHTVFQPIVDGATRDAIGDEALTRGPPGHELHSPLALIAAAKEGGTSTDLERACIDSALRSFRQLRLQGRLFLNVLPQTLLDWHDFPDWLSERLEATRIDPHDVVLEVTEHGLSEDEAMLAAAVAPLRAMGCDVAIDDLGAGSSGLKTWSALRPDYVKVDRYFLAGVEEDAVRGEILRSVVDMGRVTGCRIIAEGIENREQFALALEIGVDYLQGYLFGQPQRSPKLEMLASLQTAKPAVSADCAGHLVLQIPGIDVSMRVADVVEMFRKEPSWTALAVLEADRPVGMVHRDDLFIFLSRPLQPEVYNLEPVATVMNRAAVQIDARARLEQVSRLVTARTAGRPRDDFIVTRNGRYLGMGRTIDLLRHITAQQIQAAKHSNPLTGLPGNREIQTHLSQWLACRRAFVACHLDLDHFKAFNDSYGYARGDQVLLHVAQVITHAARPRVDFVGHVGGDDFVFLMRSQDWPLRLAAIGEALQASLVSFHSADHRSAGGLEGTGRDGMERRFPLLSASIAAVEVDGRLPVTADEVADALRTTKAAAKAKPGCSCVLASGDTLVDLSKRVSKPVLSGLSQMALFAVGSH
jgi:EAL domain-containing protein (putative c-di-GMP-specific phosphodiesterase class I)/GGDEF domain-containing protein